MSNYNFLAYFISITVEKEKNIIPKDTVEKRNSFMRKYLQW